MRPFWDNEVLLLAITRRHDDAWQEAGRLKGREPDARTKATAKMSDFNIS